MNFYRAAGLFSSYHANLTFVFIEVLFVTFIIHSLLESREKKNRINKMNMVIGVFFSEVGVKLMSYLSRCDPNIAGIKHKLVVSEDWSETKFKELSERVQSYPLAVDMGKADLDVLDSFLKTKREFMLRLLENPVLIEYESFTELLHAVFHLNEELEARFELGVLPESDLEHIRGDMVRVYSLLVRGWLDYMFYLKKTYPFLFSFALRTNPFDNNAEIIVKS